MARNIKVAVIGVGYLGKFHAKIYAAMPGVELVAVADTDPQTAREVATQHGCEALHSAAQVIGRVDAASVAVPTLAHRKVALPLLQAGVHLMLEKPIAPSVAAARAIVDTAAKHNAILQVGHLERFNAGVMKLAELVRAPRFIEVHRLGPFAGRGADVDVVNDLMIHDIDIVLSLMPARLQSIAAVGSRVLTAHADIANARLQFADGAVANVTASRVSRRQFRRIRVFSKSGYLGLNFANQQLEQIYPQSEAVNGGADAPRLVERRIEVQPQLPLDAELAHFVECIRRGGRPLVGGEEGLLAVQVAAKVRRKIAQSLKQLKNG